MKVVVAQVSTSRCPATLLVAGYEALRASAVSPRRPGLFDCRKKAVCVDWLVQDHIATAFRLSRVSGLISPVSTIAEDAVVKHVHRSC